MKHYYHRTAPRPAHELRAEMQFELARQVYAGDIAAAQATLDEMAMVFNDAGLRAAKNRSNEQ